MVYQKFYIEFFAPRDIAGKFLESVEIEGRGGFTLFASDREVCCFPCIPSPPLLF